MKWKIKEYEQMRWYSLKIKECRKWGTVHNNCSINHKRNIWLSFYTRKNRHT